MCFFPVRIMESPPCFGKGGVSTSEIHRVIRGATMLSGASNCTHCFCQLFCIRGYSQGSSLPFIVSHMNSLRFLAVEVDEASGAAKLGV
jgi:hypothetical protein